jgi:hypothetical protein
MYPYSSVVSNIQDKCMTTLEYVCICVVCFWLHWSTNIFVFYCSWLHGVRIYLSCMLLTTLRYDKFVLYGTDYTRVRIHLSCMLLTTLEYGCICVVCFWLHWSTDIFVFYCSWLYEVRIYLSCMLLTTLKHDKFVLYGTDYTGVRIHLSCLLLSTLEYIQDKCIPTPV